LKRGVVCAQRAKMISFLPGKAVDGTDRGVSAFNASTGGHIP
jgi:hypothetical protein